MSTKKYFTTTNHLSENAVALYVDAVKLDQVEKIPTEIVRHVEDCEQCAMQIMEVTELVTDDQYDKTMKHPFFGIKERKNSPFLVIYRVAAVLVIAAFIGTIYYGLNNRTMDAIPGNKPAVTQQQSIPNEHPVIGEKKLIVKPTEDLFAVNSVVSPNLEDLVQTQFRSTSIEVISPAIGEIVQTPVTFRWKQFEKKITIKILSNKELTLVSSTLSGSSFTTPKKFAPGLYYWKLETAEELLYVGKFLVR